MKDFICLNKHLAIQVASRVSCTQRIQLRNREVLACPGDILVQVLYSDYAIDSLIDYMDKHCSQIEEYLGGSIIDAQLTPVDVDFQPFMYRFETEIEIRLVVESDPSDTYMGLFINGVKVNSHNCPANNVAQQICNAATMLNDTFGWDTIYKRKFFKGDFLQMAYKEWERKYLTTMDSDLEAVKEYVRFCPKAFNSDFDLRLAINCGYHYYQKFVKHNFQHGFSAEVARMFANIQNVPETEEIFELLGLARLNDLKEARNKIEALTNSLKANGLIKYSIIWTRTFGYTMSSTIKEFWAKNDEEAVAMFQEDNSKVGSGTLHLSGNGKDLASKEFIQKEDLEY